MDILLMTKLMLYIQLSICTSFAHMLDTVFYHNNDGTAQVNKCTIIQASSPVEASLQCQRNSGCTAVERLNNPAGSYALCEHLEKTNQPDDNYVFDEYSGDFYWREYNDIWSSDPFIQESKLNMCVTKTND